MFVPQISLKTNELEFQKPKEKIQLQIFSEPCSPELMVNQLAAVQGPMDVYVWYEGTQCLPKVGALFMKKRIFNPLHKIKHDAKLNLYSLRGWDFKKSVDIMPFSTKLGEAINRIHCTAVTCIYSYAFFRYCKQVSKESGLYMFINDELPKKNWFFKSSSSQRKSGMTVQAFFDGQPSLLDCIQDLDLSSAYSQMQYIEGFYLIRESVQKGLSKGQRTINIAFALPNDESKYYLDLPKDIERMLQLDFGKDLVDVQINISFHFFQYGNSLMDRPYIDKQNKAKVSVKEIESYFDYLHPPKQPRMLFLRDVIFHLNEYV